MIGEVKVSDAMIFACILVGSILVVAALSQSILSLMSWTSVKATRTAAVPSKSVSL
jgi:hypothetical protein